MTVIDDETLRQKHVFLSALSAFPMFVPSLSWQMFGFQSKHACKKDASSAPVEQIDQVDHIFIATRQQHQEGSRRCDARLLKTRPFEISVGFVPSLSWKIFGV
jgi:hypothetical protein